MANRYWVGGTGTWNPASTSWSTTSGGSPGSAAPLATDNAIFDANSGGGTITIEDGAGGSGNPPECADLICTGFTGSIDSSGYGLYINGDVTLSVGGDYTLFWLIIISPTVCTLTSVGKFVYEIDIEPGATLALADDAYIDSNGLFLIGTFTTNNFNVTVNSYFNITGTLNMGSSTFNVGDLWYADPGSTVNAGTSTINMSGVEFDGGGKTYYNLNIGSSFLEILGNNTFNTISNSVQPTTIRFGSGKTQTVTNFNVSGTAGNLVTLQSTSVITRFTLSKSSGTVSVNYLNIIRSNATGGAAWYAGANSTNGASNLGWIFTAPPSGPSGGKLAVRIKGNVKINKEGILKTTTYFDEVSLGLGNNSSGYQVANELNEMTTLTYNGIPVAQRISSNGVLSVSGYFDEVNY